MYQYGSLFIFGYNDALQPPPFQPTRHGCRCFVENGQDVFTQK